jgi:predicted P-loop ATPase
MPFNTIQEAIQNQLGHLTIDVAIAQEFLSALGYDPNDTVYLNTFYPSKSSNSKGDHGKKIHGKFRAKIQEIEKHQRLGKGVYLVVNGGGYNKTDIETCRAFFIEHDDLPKEDSAGIWQILDLPEPTIQIDTGGKSIHSYWVLEEEISASDWEQCQKDLIEMSGADKQIKNSNRLMRLAGGWHIDEYYEHNQSVIYSHSGKKINFEDFRSKVSLPAPLEPEPIPTPQIKIDYPVGECPPIPLEKCISLKTRERLLSGSVDGEKNADGMAVAADLIGTARRLTELGIVFDGDPYLIFCAYADRSGAVDKSEGRWKFYEGKSDVRPSCPDNALQACLNRWRKDNGYSTQETNVIPFERSPKENYQPPNPSKNDYQEPQKETGKGSAFHRILSDLEPLLVGRTRFNLITESIEVDGQGIDIWRFRRDKMANNSKFGWTPKEEYEQAVIQIAERQSYHPIHNYLNGVYGTHQAILNPAFCQLLFSELLTVCLKIEVTPLYLFFIEKFLLQAIARIKDPGSQADYMLVLQGEQGSKKSSFLPALCADPSWTSASLLKIGHADTFEVMRKKWLIEIPELDKLTEKKAFEAQFKEFITRREDSYRVAHGRQGNDVKRSCVLMGTVNKIDFLNDATGNRRFWVLPGIDTPIDLAWLVSNRDLIWAAGMYLYEQCPNALNSTSKIIINDDDESLLRQSTDENLLFEPDSAWYEAIQTYMAVRQGDQVTVRQILTECLLIEIGKITRSQEMEVAAILKKLGFVRGPSKVLRYWLKK